MADPSPHSPKPLDVGTGGSLTHELPDEGIRLNKYHLILAFERLSQRRQGPNLEHVAVPLALFLGTLLALLPTEFQNYWGLEAAVWEAMANITAILTGVITLVLFVWWCKTRIGHREGTPEQFVDDLIEQMAKDRERMATIRSQPEIDTEGSRR